MRDGPFPHGRIGRATDLAERAGLHAVPRRLRRAPARGSALLRASLRAADRRHAHRPQRRQLPTARPPSCRGGAELGAPRDVRRRALSLCDSARSTDDGGHVFLDSYDGATLLDLDGWASGAAGGGAWAPQPGWSLTFSAANGGLADNHWIDNLRVRTGARVATTPVPLSVSLNGQQFVELGGALTCVGGRFCIRRSAILGEVDLVVRRGGL